MQELNTLLDAHSNLLFIAPTGWGKTTLLLDLVQKSAKCWIYIAPLRALANEFYVRANKKIKQTFLISHAYEVHQLLQNSIEFKLLIITPELLHENLLLKFQNKTNVVLDELHLFYYWGRDFRPKLMDCYENVMSLQVPCLSLTATMSEELLEKWQQDSKLNYEHSYCINLKNHTLKQDPSKIFFVPQKFKNLVWQKMIHKKVPYATLIFCAYREEVKQKHDELKRYGFKVLSCIGGETQTFLMELQKCATPDFILSTSTLSHGVNLPKISRIYISYPVKNYDFWVQMVGRGGRRGEDFQVFTRDSYRINYFSKVLSFLYWSICHLGQKFFPYELRRYFNTQNPIQRARYYCQTTFTKWKSD